MNKKILHKLESKKAALESRIATIDDQVKNHGVHISYLQLRIYRKRRAILNNSIKGIEKQIKLLPQMKLF